MDLNHTHPYTIGMVARRTHIHPETLRVWERRYELTVPGRSDTGRRLYSEEDITKLSLVKQLTDLGHPVSGLAKLSTQDLRARLFNASAREGTARSQTSVKCRVLFANETLRLRMARDLLLFQDIDIVALPKSGASENNLKFADVLILEFPTVNEQTLVEVQRSMSEYGCATALLMFNFGAKQLIAQLERAGITCFKGSATAEQLHRACLAAFKPVHDKAALKAAGVTSPRFDASQLAMLSGLSSTIACECPNHLAELLVSLSAFEKYSSECANRDDKDAYLHAQLTQSAGMARVILEDSLLRLIEIEGIQI
jgi:DNA-binding transcriptional MerR regulator